MINFVALDFETATHERHSACELGICVVEDAQIVKTHSWLIKPPSFPYFSPRNMEVHGITPQDVAEAPTFDEIWSEVEELLYGNMMIAHNAAFDAGVLRGSLDYYGIFKPKTKYLCSVQLARKSWKDLKSYGLKNLAEHHQIRFNHHRAGDDAEACARIALLAFERLFITRNDEAEQLLAKNLKLL